MPNEPTPTLLNQRITNSLKPSSPEGYATSVTTQPTRTVTCVYPSGFQSQHGDEVKKGNNNGSY